MVEDKIVLKSVNDGGTYILAMGILIKQNCSVQHKLFTQGIETINFQKHNQLSTPYQGIWRLNQSILGIETTPCSGLC